MFPCPIRDLGTKSLNLDLGKKFHSVFCAGEQRVDPQRAGGSGGPHPLREREDAAIPRGHAHRQRYARPTQGHAEERPPTQGHQSQAQGQLQPISLVGFSPVCAVASGRLFLHFIDHLTLLHPVLGPRDIILWIRILGSIPLTNGFGCGSGRKQVPTD
jgi:hypothetical protein